MNTPKKSQHKTIAALAILALALTAGVGSTFAARNGGGFGDKVSFFKGGHHQNYENHEQARAAVEAGDYTAWVEAVGEAPFAKKVTEENFSEFTQLHALMEEGNWEEVKALRKELGIGLGGERTFHKMKFSKEGHEEMMAALDNRDYEAWGEAAAASPKAEGVTAENFDRFVDMHELFKAGDKEEGMKIAEELGLTELWKAQKDGHRFMRLKHNR